MELAAGWALTAYERWRWTKKAQAEQEGVGVQDKLWKGPYLLNGRTDFLKQKAS